MPLFSRNPEPAVATPPPPPVEEERHQRTGLFGSRRRTSRSPSPTPTAATNSTVSTQRTGMFGRRSSVTSNGTNVTNGTTPSRHRSLLHRTFGNGNDDSTLDPSIVTARERVMSAENAEREADRMLDIARREVRDARDQVRALEVEAKEDARKAKIKQFHAREVSKRVKPLGRHGL